jgi:hypothetical protein
MYVHRLFLPLRLPPANISLLWIKFLSTPCLAVEALMMAVSVHQIKADAYVHPSGPSK